MRLLELEDFKSKEFLPLKNKLSELEFKVQAFKKATIGLGLLTVISVAVNILVLLK